jgi:hypothetical protein
MHAGGMVKNHWSLETVCDFGLALWKMFRRLMSV